MSLFHRCVNKLHSLDLQHHYSEKNSPDMLRHVTEDSLLWHWSNFHSQRGQDGILGHIFRELNISRGVFVEFGAWDGLYLSNARRLYEMGWSGLYIEGNPRRFQALEANYRDADSVHVLNHFVGAPSFAIEGRPLADLLSRVGMGEPDFVSIDVDGVDLEIFEDMGVRPSVVLLEGGASFCPLIDEKIELFDARLNLQHPLGAIVCTAEDLGYSPVCFFQDTYLIRTDLLPAGLRARSAVELFSDMWHFATDQFREDVIKARLHSEAVRRIETKHFGVMHPNPMAYI
jgi:hypothetical protein